MVFFMFKFFHWPLVISLVFALQPQTAQASLSKSAKGPDDISIEGPQVIRSNLHALREEINQCPDNQAVDQYARWQATLEKQTEISKLLIELNPNNQNELIGNFAIDYLKNSFYDEFVQVFANPFIDSYFSESKREAGRSLELLYYTALLPKYLQMDLESTCYVNFSSLIVKFTNNLPLSKFFWKEFRDTVTVFLEKTQLNPLFQDCVICNLEHCMRGYPKDQQYTKFFQWLYTKSTSDLAQYFYAENCLDSTDKRSLKIGIYKTLLEKERFQTCKLSLKLVIEMILEKKYEEAIPYAKLAKLLDEEDFVCAQALARVYFLVGKYQESIEELIHGLTLPGANAHENHIKDCLLVACSMANNMEKMGELLQERQLKALFKKKNALSKQKENEKKTAELIRKQQSNIQKQKELQQNSQSLQRKLDITPKSKSSKTTNEYIFQSSPTETKNLKREYRNNTEKTKIKTRGKAKTTENQIENKQTPQPSKIEIITIEALLKGKPKSAYTTFCDLFQSIKGIDCKISIADISSLFDALEQDFDPSKGKGSHTKVTISKDFANAGQEKMLILANEKFLTAAQINNLVQTFLDYDLYPKDMTELLRKKMLRNVTVLISNFRG